MRLIDKATGKEVRIGDTVFDSDGEAFAVDYYRQPPNPASSGKITISNNNERTIERYVGIFNLEWIEREDRGWVHPELELKRVLDIYKQLTNVDMSGWNLDDVIGEVQVIEIGSMTGLKSRPDAMFLLEWLDKQ